MLRSRSAALKQQQREAHKGRLNTRYTCSSTVDVQEYNAVQHLYIYMISYSRVTKARIVGGVVSLSHRTVVPDRGDRAEPHLTLLRWEKGSSRGRHALCAE